VTLPTKPLKTNKARDQIDRAYLDVPGKYCDGAGLYLSVARDEESKRLGLPIHKSGAGGASYTFRHKNREASIGSAKVYSIKYARETAAQLWDVACKGGDPFALLKTMRAGPAALGGKTFAEAMTEYLDANASRLSASNRDRTRKDYEYQLGQVPDFVKLPIKAIDQNAKNAALATWNDRPGIQGKVRYYINAILKYAETGKLKDKAGAVAVEHHESLPYAQVPKFYASLPDTVDANALRFLILTGMRTSEVIGGEAKAPATWSEITMVDGEPTWIIDGSRMKNGQTHRVPLSNAAATLLGDKRKADNVPLFKVSSMDALRDVLKANGGNGFTVHGFRASLQEWGVPIYGADLMDTCIAHGATGGKVRKAYQRGDRLTERRPILQGWSDFVAGK
jgi:integrase